MNDSPFAILVVHYNKDKTNYPLWLMRVAQQLEPIGAVKLADNVFLLKHQEAMPILAALYVDQNRLLEAYREIHFALVPCGKQVFSELPSGVAEALKVAGLYVWEMSVAALKQSR